MKNNFNRLVALSWGSVVGTLCTLATVQPANAITFVLDFKESSQGTTTDLQNIEVGSFDVTSFGFDSSEFSTVTNAIFNKVQSHYSNIPTVSEYTGTTTSPIPDGQKLDINFEIGDLLALDGTVDFTPANAADAADGSGIGDFYFVQIGSFENDPNNALGGVQAAGFASDNAARNSAGDANPANIPGNFAESRAVASIFTDVINTVTTPSSPNENILTTPPGDLDATVNAIAGTISHEIAHTLSLLDHIHTDAAETDGNVPPIMASTSTGLTSDDRISDRSFSFSAFDQAGGSSGGGTEQNYVSDLVTVLGTTNSASVPFEFSPGMGLLLVGGTWGIASVRKKSQQKNQLKK